MGGIDTQDLDALSEVSAWFIETCSSITDDQWGLPTPCTDWNLEHLVNHVTGGNRFTVDILRGVDGHDALASAIASFEPDHDIQSGASSSIHHQLQAFNGPGVLDRLCSHLDAQLTGRQILHVRTHELIIHTWDMAQAISTPAAIAPDLAAWAIGELARPSSLTIERFGIRPSGGLPESHTPQEALLAVFGRIGLAAT